MGSERVRKKRGRGVVERGGRRRDARGGRGYGEERREERREGRGKERREVGRGDGLRGREARIIDQIRRGQAPRGEEMREARVEIRGDGGGDGVQSRVKSFRAPRTDHPQPHFVYSNSPLSTRDISTTTCPFCLRLVPIDAAGRTCPRANATLLLKSVVMDLPLRRLARS